MSKLLPYALALLAWTAPAFQCGTLQSFAANVSRSPGQKRYVYSGVRQDIAQLGGGRNVGGLRTCGVSAGLADLPFSLVADTILLPVTLFFSVHNYYCAEPVIHCVCVCASNGPLVAAEVLRQQSPRWRPVATRATCAARNGRSCSIYKQGGQGGSAAGTLRCRSRAESRSLIQ